MANDIKKLINLSGYDDAQQLSFNDFVQPITQIKSIDKISRNLPALLEQGDKNKKGIKTTIDNKGNISITAAFDFSEVQTSKNISEKEKAITDAVINLVQRGYTYFTPAQVFLEYRGATAKTKRRVTTEEQQEIIAILDKLNDVKVKIDATDLIAARGISGVSDKISDRWIDLQKHEITNENQYGDHTSIVYVVKSQPIIYQYQQLLAGGGDHLQQISYNKELLAIPGKSQTDARVIIGRLLIEHIEQLKNKSNTYRQLNITFDRISKALEVDCPKTSLRKIREIAEDYLSTYKRRGYITKYEYNQKGRAIVSITIYPNPKFNSNTMEQE